MKPFRLYPEERHFWSFNDYGHVLETVRRLNAKSVLEFGPGSSTLALIEGGATLIDCCEDDPDWLAVYRERLEGVYPKIVRLIPYDRTTMDIRGRLHRYDMALIDGPFPSVEREASIWHAVSRCDAVLVCCETHHSIGLVDAIKRVADAWHKDCVITETGPLAGSFALIR